jgi:Fe2+ transport system protein B
MSGSCASCASCSAGKGLNLQRLGLRMDRWDHVVALAGNPNTGKSTLFNALTGLRQHTGNWPGKTIARAEGGFSYEGKAYKLVDLPGTYSLLSASQDEEIARDFILFGRPEVTVVVADATRLERNLNLVLQVLQITDRVVVCLNLIDEAEAHGISVDARGLARDLGVPVVPTAARQNVGIDALLRQVADVATGATVCRPRRLRLEAPGLRPAVDRLARMVRDAFPGTPHTEWIALRLLEGDPRIAHAVTSGDLGVLAEDRPEGLVAAAT